MEEEFIRNKNGRPAKGLQKRKARHSVSLTEAEDTIIRERASKAGLPPAVYIRRASLGCTIHQRITPEQNKMLKGVYNIGNNLNQLVKELHSRNDMYYCGRLPPLISDMEDIYKYFKRIRNDR